MHFWVGAMSISKQKDRKMTITSVRQLIINSIERYEAQETIAGETEGTRGAIVALKEVLGEIDGEKGQVIRG